MSDYFDLLERELRAAVPRVATPRGATAIRLTRGAGLGLPGLRVGLGRMAVALAAVVAVAVAAGAVVLLGHRHAALRPPAAAPPPGAPANPHINPTAPLPAVPAIGLAHGTYDVLDGGGISTLRFGASAARAQALLLPLLGRPASRHRYRLDCGVDGVITWSPRGLLGPLALYFGHGRLVGYQYGDASSQRQRWRPVQIGAPLALATTGGLELGDSMAQARRLYGPRFRVSAAQGGSWSVHTVGGRMDGYVLIDPNTGRVVSSRDRVATIDAGTVGCPALSP